MTEVVKDYGYRDSSGIHRVVKRLECRAESDPALAAQLERWRASSSRVKS